MSGTSSVSQIELPYTNTAYKNVEINCELGETLRKFANRDIAKIASILNSEGPLTFKELMNKFEEEKITTKVNVLNHNLIEMKRTKIIIQDKGTKQYRLTTYGTLLWTTLEDVKERMMGIQDSILYKI